MKTGLITIEDAIEFRAEAKAKGKTVGYTSGVFDIIHPGHVEYLSKAQRACDYLIVGVNSDSSVRLNKGEKRPINPEQGRAQVVSALASVSAVFIFSERNNNLNIEKLRPDFYIKAGDYDKKNLSSAPIVESYGGKVLLIPLQSRTSTTGTIEAILEKYAPPTAESFELDSPKPRPAAFIDRDGTIIEHVEYLSEAAKLKMLPGSIDGLRKLQDAGFRLIVVTNQQGIGLGYLTREDFFRVNKELLKQVSGAGISIDKIYFCPHSVADACDCRKPSTLFIDRAFNELNLDLKNSVVIGDMESDIEFGKNANLKSVLILHGNALEKEGKESNADFQTQDLSAAADWAIANTHVKDSDSAPLRQKPNMLEAVGKLGGRLGHDFNNLLGAISGCVDLIRSKLDKLPGGNPAERQLKLIDNSLKKSVEITAKIRAYARPGPLDFDTTRISTCALAAIQLINQSESFPAKIERNRILIELGPDPELRANEFGITHVLFDLLVNALESMSATQGKVVLTSSMHERKLRSNRSVNELKVSILDQGPGIPESVRKELFCPFTSTRAEKIGWGYGLSLPMAQEIMKKHSGRISVDSSAGVGSRVDLYFPL